MLTSLRFELLSLESIMRVRAAHPEMSSVGEAMASQRASFVVRAVAVNVEKQHCDAFLAIVHAIGKAKSTSKEDVDQAVATINTAFDAAAKNFPDANVL